MITGNTHFIVVSWYFWTMLLAMTVTSPSARAFVLDFSAKIPFEQSTTLSIAALGVGLLISVAVGHFISSIFSFVFYLTKGYERFAIHREVTKTARELLRHKDGHKSEVATLFSSIDPVSFESFLIYHYASTDFIAWIRRRYAVYFTNMTVICSLFFAAIAAFAVDFHLSWSRLAVLSVAVLFAGVLYHNSRTPIREILDAERLFARRVLPKAVNEFLALDNDSKDGAGASNA